MLIKKYTQVKLQKHTLLMASQLQYQLKEDSRVFLPRIQQVLSINILFCKFILMDAICLIYEKDVQFIYTNFVQLGYVNTIKIFYEAVEKFGSIECKDVDETI